MTPPNEELGLQLTRPHACCSPQIFGAEDQSGRAFHFFKVILIIVIVIVTATVVIQLMIIVVAIRIP